jgi:hypothetical protein
MLPRWRAAVIMTATFEDLLAAARPHLETGPHMAAVPAGDRAHPERPK